MTVISILYLAKHVIIVKRLCVYLNNHVHLDTVTFLLPDKQFFLEQSTINLTRISMAMNLMHYI